MHLLAWLLGQVVCCLLFGCGLGGAFLRWLAGWCLPALCLAVPVAWLVAGGSLAGVAAEMAVMWCRFGLRLRRSVKQTIVNSAKRARKYCHFTVSFSSTV
jgi:membrane protein implicated in regulation of membrane protease activity